MPRKSKFKLPPLNIGKETVGQRIARIRKEKGYTQAQLAEKIGIIQALVSEYERDKLRPYYDVVIRFAMALEVSTDELLGLKPRNGNESKPSLKIVRRMKKIESLPESQQKALFKTIDNFIKGAQK